MKGKLIFTIIFSLLISTGFTRTDYTKAGMDYTDTLVKNTTAKERVAGFKNYIQKYTDTNNEFVVLAYYQLAMNLFRTQNYAATVSYGCKTLKLKGLGDVEKAHLLLAMANSYAVKSASVFSINKSRELCVQARELAQKIGSQKIAQSADDIWRRLDFTPISEASATEKIKYYHRHAKYDKVISIYNSLSVQDRNKPSIHRYFALSLLKAKRYQRAIKELKMVFSRETTGFLSCKIGEAYAGSGHGSDKNANLQEAVEYFLQAGWLYARAGQTKLSNNAFNQAKYWLFEKHDFSKEMAQMKKSRTAGKAVSEEVKQKERAILREFTALKKRFKTHLKLSFDQ
jgi:hypothetical protein